MRPSAGEGMRMERKRGAVWAVGLCAVALCVAQGAVRAGSEAPGRPAAVAALIDRMAQDDFAGSQASGKLAEMGERAVPALIEALGHDTPRVRYWSIAALSRIGDERAVGPIIRLLKQDADATVRAVAVWHLGRWFERQDVREAVLGALEDPEAFVRTWAFRVIGYKRYAGALPRLRELLQSEDVTRRYGALRAIAEVQGEDAIETLVTALRQDSSAEVRAAAVYHLGAWFDAPQARQAIIEALADEDKFVRGWALNVVAEHRYTEALPQAMELMKSDDEQVRFDAVRAIAMLKGREAVEFLKGVVERDPSALVREAALRSATVLEPPTARSAEVLMAGLEDEDPELRHLAAVLLRKGFLQRFGFDPAAPVEQRRKAVARWRQWYQQSRERLRWDGERRVFVIASEG